MVDEYMEIYRWYGIMHQIQGVSVFVFFLIGNVAFAISDGSACVLDFGNGTASSLDNVSYMKGTWGGFLNKDSCAGPFEEYLYALALHTSQTGQIFLKSDEQRNCLTTLTRPGIDVLGCGIEKLTRGGGSCSDYSVKDVNSKFGEAFQSMKENCELEDQSKNQGQSCGSCLKSWENIKGSYLDNDKPIDSEYYICRFAVLVSLASTKIVDERWIQEISGCLVNQNQVTIMATSSDTEAGDTKEKRKISTRTWILFGSIIGILIVIIVSIWIVLRRRWKPNTTEKDDGVNLSLPKDSDHLKFSIKEVYTATNNLHTANFIGEGMAGKVYRGTLPNNQHVAVKQITDEGYTETFFREIKSLSKVRHPNLVALLGYCRHKNECFLLYELCPNGNLSEWIFGKDKRLSWVHRLKIAIQCARGLSFLHNYPTGCIVHRDIKVFRSISMLWYYFAPFFICLMHTLNLSLPKMQPTNILLGAKFEAKLSDFGLSKVIDLGDSYKSSEVRGTFGYVDPEYENTKRVDSGGDVYSFGVVLLQIISGRKVINLNMNTPMPLNKMAKSLTRNDSIRGFADPKLEGDYCEEAFSLTFRLALSCTTRKKERPSMEIVTLKLEEALDISTTIRSSTPNTTPDWCSTPRTPNWSSTPT